MNSFNAYCRFLVAFIICCGLVIQGKLCFAQTSSDSGTAQRGLQKWVEQDLFFFKDRGGQARLFLRREPVRVALSLGSTPIKDDLSYLISKLSKAAGVSYEHAASDVNLAIIVDSPINSGDRPNPELWKRVGLSDEMYNIASETGNWSSGCGTYSFSNAETGQVGLSIIFVDSKLESSRIRDCATDGTLRAFGVRSNRKSILTSEDGYLQFVFLIKALSACEKSIGIAPLTSMTENEQKLKYAECAADLLDR